MLAPLFRPAPGFNVLNRHHSGRSELEIPQTAMVQGLNAREAPSVLPKEANQAELAYDTNHMVCAFSYDGQTMHTASEHFHNLGQACRLWHRDKRTLLPQILDKLDGDRATGTGLLGQLFKRRKILVLLWLIKTHYKEEKGIQIGVVKGAADALIIV